MKLTTDTGSGAIPSLIVLACVALTWLAHAEDNLKANAEHGVAGKAADDRKKVEFFEQLYKIKIKDVKPLEEYSDPDAFYAAIAKQVGIPEMALEAVEKKHGWKQGDEFFLSTTVKGGWEGDYWVVMVTKFPAALKQAKTNEERTKLIGGMKMQMVIIGYDGSISFADAPGRAR